jgi:hypothetical protein
MEPAGQHGDPVLPFLENRHDELYYDADLLTGMGDAVRRKDGARLRVDGRAAARGKHRAGVLPSPAEGLAVGRRASHAPLSSP